MTLAAKIKENKAFYAAAGAGDLAAEKLREVPDQLAKLQEKTDAKDLGGAAVAYVTHIGSRAVQVFDELAERGKTVVSRANHEQAAKELQDTGRAGSAGRADQKSPTE